MAKMVFDERYGEISYAQRAAYRKYNVSPSDHYDLVRVFGESEHKAITDAVKRYTRNGMFSAWDMMKEEGYGY